MKTISLSELLAEATPGPYRPTDPKQSGYDNDIYGNNGKASCVARVYFEDDAALLAHAANHIGPLVEALERLNRNYRLTLAGKPVRDVEETLVEVKQALAAAKEVRLT